MDGFVLGLFLFAAFLCGFASGLAGFAMGFIVAGIWLHSITPLQTAALIAGYGLCTQGYGVWKLRHALNWQNVVPFIVGGAVGVPIGTMLLRYADPTYLRSGVGVLLVIYGLYGLMQPVFRPLQVGPTADGGVGFLNGIVCGLTGFPGFIITIWCQLRGWKKRLSARSIPAGIARGHRCERHIAGCCARDHRRYATTVLDRFAGDGSGPWVGFRLYGKLNDAAFRQIILALLLIAGLGLIPPSIV